MKTKFPAMVMVFGVVSSEGHIMPPHIFESGGWWQTLGVAAGLGARLTSPKRPRLGFRRSATTLYPSLTGPPLLPQPEPAGLLHLVICREHHQHDLPQHQSSLIAAIRRVFAELPAGACRKGMLPVLDPYRGGD